MPPSEKPLVVIEATVCTAPGCGCVMHSGDGWCGHVGSGEKVTLVPESTRDELWEIAIGNGDHDPRCGGDCGPCGGAGGVPDTGPEGMMALTCLTCGGSGRCLGCSVGYRLRTAERRIADFEASRV